MESPVKSTTTTTLKIGFQSDIMVIHWAFQRVNIGVQNNILVMQNLHQERLWCIKFTNCKTWSAFQYHLLCPIQIIFLPYKKLLGHLTSRNKNKSVFYVIRPLQTCPGSKRLTWNVSCNHTVYLLWNPPMMFRSFVLNFYFLQIKVIYLHDVSFICIEFLFLKNKSHISIVYIRALLVRVMSPICVINVRCRAFLHYL